MTTGEVLLPEASITEGAGDRILVRARIQHTFPLETAEIVWGDGAETFRKIVPLNETRLCFSRRGRGRQLEVGAVCRVGCGGE